MPLSEPKIEYPCVGTGPKILMRMRIAKRCPDHCVVLPFVVRYGRSCISNLWVVWSGYPDNVRNAHKAHCPRDGVPVVEYIILFIGVEQICHSMQLYIPVPVPVSRVYLDNENNLLYRIRLIRARARSHR